MPSSPLSIFSITCLPFLWVTKSPFITSTTTIHFFACLIGSSFFSPSPSSSLLLHLLCPTTPLMISLFFFPYSFSSSSSFFVNLFIFPYPLPPSPLTSHLVFLLFCRHHVSCVAEFPSCDRIYLVHEISSARQEKYPSSYFPLPSLSLPPFSLFLVRMCKCTCEQMEEISSVQSHVSSLSLSSLLFQASLLHLSHAHDGETNLSIAHFLSWSFSTFHSHFLYLSHAQWEKFSWFLLFSLLVRLCHLSTHTHKRNLSLSLSLTIPSFFNVSLSWARAEEILSCGREILLLFFSLRSDISLFSPHFCLSSSISSTNFPLVHVHHFYFLSHMPSS